jgi:hypothetical protein
LKLDPAGDESSGEGHGGGQAEALANIAARNARFQRGGRFASTLHAHARTGAQPSRRAEGSGVGESRSFLADVKHLSE